MGAQTVLATAPAIPPEIKSMKNCIYLFGWFSYISKKLTLKNLNLINTRPYINLIIKSK